MHPSRAAAPALLALLLCPAAPATAQVPDCAPPHTLSRTETCALIRSPTLEEARQAVAAAQGQRLTAGALLAKPPELLVSGSRRFKTAEPGATWNWSVALQQDVEVAGQRGARLAQAEAALGAAEQRLSWTHQQERARVEKAWLETVASRDLLRIQEQALAFGERLEGLIEERPAGQRISPLEADLLRARTAELAIQRDEAEARYLRAKAVLHRLLGVEPQLPEDAVLAVQPQPGAAPPALDRRADVVAAALERRGAEAAVSLQRRARVPTPKVGAFVDEDGFAERVVGVSLAVPLFLPSVVAVNGAGELQTAMAELGTATAKLQAARDEAELEVRTAAMTWEARHRTVARFKPGLMAREQAHLRELEAEVGDGTLLPRDAVRAHRAIVALQTGEVEARLGEATARIELLLARGELATGPDRDSLSP